MTTPAFDLLLVRAADATAKTQRGVDLILDAMAKLPTTDQGIVVDGLNQLLDEQARVADLYATERVSKERAVSRALRRPDCDVHRDELGKLRFAAVNAAQQAARSEAGRLALLVGIDRLGNAADRRDVDRATGTPPTETYATMVRRLVSQAHDEHRKAWS